jgi:2-oxoglutarate dehydrogenase E1 component
VLSADDVKRIDDEVRARFQQAYDAVRHASADEDHSPEGPPAPPAPPVQTAVPAERLVALQRQMLTYPEGFQPHPKLVRILARRADALGEQGGIEWGQAEALAFATLLAEGTSVRLTGQDAERGTFGHRNAVLHDPATGNTHAPLAAVAGDRAAFEVYNSPLTETAVMAFEYGYSVAASDTLTLWEAQYGDFVNVGQVIIDQFLVADRAKWSQDSGLVLLLPHGYEGGGPEHSSARLERFLQQAAEGNMTVAYPGTPAQYFHLLRRQAKRDPRRPLVLMQPKSLLRLPVAASRLTELAEGGWQPVVVHPAAQGSAAAVRRVVLCTAKMYYDLTAQSLPAEVAVVRLDQLYPFPGEALTAALAPFGGVREVVWAQEEPQNMGAWTFVAPRLRGVLPPSVTLGYVGRPERASPAEGYEVAHKAEQARIVAEALAVTEPARVTA